MKVTDYIVQFLIQKNIKNVFGYPGGMVTHLMESFDKCKNQISAHVTYHEQAAAFCACGYAQVTHLPGVAYATSGPGATNLVTGIANAYFDSIPCIFITGQVNTYEAKTKEKVRQKGFQEMNVVKLVDEIVKYAVQVTKPEEIRYELEKAFYLSLDKRPGPVLLDIPMNIQRAEIQPDSLRKFDHESQNDLFSYEEIKNRLFIELKKAKRPIILAGAGISASGIEKEFLKLAKKIGVPVVTSMIGRDCISDDAELSFGFIGAYGHRYANVAIAKSDLIISMGSRVDCRQTGSNKEIFATNAKLIRIDIDENEVTNKIKDNEIDLICDLRDLVLQIELDERFALAGKYKNWIEECNFIKEKLMQLDNLNPNQLIKKISELVPNDAVITTDVGQNQVWVAQDFLIKSEQRVLFSGGHGAMGYSLPAAIGAYYAKKKPVICFCGDGGLQMNIQELQFVIREQIPVKIVLLNNHSLGMIRHFQEMYFNNNSVQTTETHGYTVPNFNKLAKAYGLKSYTISDVYDVEKLKDVLKNNEPAFIEVLCGDKTYVYPKLAMGRPTYDQEPLIERKLIEELLHYESKIV